MALDGQANFRRESPQSEAWGPASLPLAILALSLAPMLLTGCVSKAKADAQARAAFIAGQQQATQQMQSRGPSVTIMGEVRNPLVPWTIGLTLAKAVIAADYYGLTDPAEIIITRDGEQIFVEPGRLLSGEDFPLLPRDIVELKR